ncbi:sensor histidine kinase [Microbacterium pumilum]|uniref:histidine kinase n=1 Tax=Microbacterium pumilum TaxID=344165 RepID=A0ABN2RTF1_9MICO
MTAAPATIRRVSIGASGVVMLACAVGLSITENPAASFFAGTGPLPLLLTAAGISLLASGLVVLQLRATWRTGPLLVLASILWFSPVWIAWDSGPLFARSLGTILALFTPFVLATIVMGFPDGREPLPRRHRVLVATGIALGVAAAIFAFSYDPFQDVGCWATCGGSAFLIVPLPWLAGAAFVTASGLDVFVVGVAMLSAFRDATVRRSASSWLAVSASTVLLLGIALKLIVEATAGSRGPGNMWAETGQAAIAGGGLLLSIAIASQIWIIRRRQTAVDAIVQTTSGGQSSAIQESLRQATGDSTLSLAFWLPESQQYIDCDGMPVEPPSDSVEVRTVTIAREGRSVATIGHSALTEIESHLGPALRLAIENESLRVELEVQLRELRSARTRIVIAQDDRRRELERALHDGAQHRLTVLVLQLRALADLADAGDLQCADDLQQGIALARAAIDDLREVARGVYPTILESGGLLSALATYATSAPIAIEFDSVAPERVDRAVEMTAYRFVVSAVEDASRRLASHATVTIVAAGGTLTVTVKDDAADAPAPLPSTLDRVGAIGGLVHAHHGRIVAELPCES